MQLAFDAFRFYRAAACVHGKSARSRQIQDFFHPQPHENKPKAFAYGPRINFPLIG
jgi:hypothetical protein